MKRARIMVDLGWYKFCAYAKDVNGADEIVARTIGDEISRFTSGKVFVTIDGTRV